MIDIRVNTQALANDLARTEQAVLRSSQGMARSFGSVTQAMAGNLAQANQSLRRSAE